MKKIPTFSTRLVKNQIVLQQNHQLSFTHKHYHKFYTYIRAGLRIGKTAIAIEKPLQGTEEEIIKQIHAIRYNETNPYVITGGHFYQIFVRNLGVFFNALLDPRIPSTEEDWFLRQSIALKTLAHDLTLFTLAGKEFTTLTPVSKDLYTGLNLYARPSDSLHAIVYTFSALINDRFIEERFPMKHVSKRPLQTKKTGHDLLQKYTSSLKDLIQTYYEELIDPKTHIIKKNLLLSSARDGIKRQSSFYDNVILWSTIRLAKELGLHTISDKQLALWKKDIITAFWDKEEGIFLDDLSPLSQKKKLFSADIFIVTSSGFLNIRYIKERKMLLQMIQYVKKHKLDRPFPLHYSAFDQPKKLYRPVRHFAPSYMGTSIWCHWGMEYIKVLISLSKENVELLIDAKKHLATYKANIEKYGGYPEVYDTDGKILNTRLYRSVLYNGWVINYEQTKMLLQNA
ncbi:MAG: hypothetical protein H0W89_04795 [Candidatus Levybacteria bacterium]|nr:hypothetical protein [Candidatus Levybacteria bacterium]